MRRVSSPLLLLTLLLAPVPARTELDPAAAWLAAAKRATGGDAWDGIRT